MIKNHTKRIFSIALAAALFLCQAFSSFAFAEGEPSSIAISPVSEKLELKPGKTYTGTLKVRNTGDDDFDYKVYVEPYFVTDENASPSFEITNQYTQLADWVTLSRSDGSLEAGTHEEIKYTIKVPDGVAGGGQYAAIVAETVNDGKGMIQTTSRVGELLYASVDGKTNECVKIVNNSVNAFMFEPPISASSLIENCGNVHEEAEYTMRVYPLFSDREIYTNEESPETHIVLPGTRRFSTTSWTKEQGAPSIGIYNVEHVIKVGDETSVTKQLVFIFPLWLVIIFILLIAAIVFRIVSRFRSRKESERSSVNSED